MTLAEELGYSKHERLLIINADDFGLCHSVNYAVKRLLEANAVSSATVMMPCGWAPEAALWSARHQQYDVGIHLTFTSEWEPYSWGPVTNQSNVSSLVTREGYFPADCQAFEEQANDEQVRIEMINQIERALSLGMKPTHADNHMGSLYGLQTGRSFLPAVFDVCASYGLPFRMPRYFLHGDRHVTSPELLEQAKQLAALADVKGVVILDYLVSLPFQLLEGETYISFKTDMIRLLSSLQPGVTELYIHPSLATDELKAFHGQPVKRGMEYDLFLDPDIQQTLQQQNIRLIHWRDLQKVQQSRN